MSLYSTPFQREMSKEWAKGPKPQCVTQRETWFAWQTWLRNQDAQPTMAELFLMQAQTNRTLLTNTTLSNSSCPEYLLSKCPLFSYAYILSYYCEQYKMFMLERLNKQRARMSPKLIVYCLFDSECSIVLTFHQNHQHRASYYCPWLLWTSCLLVPTT